jgi:hypothetical protein
LLKQKAFIIEKFLDTAFRCPIRFRQKVLMVFSELRWNYSPLKEKAVLLPDGLFVYLVAARQTARELRLSHEVSAPDAGRSARTGLASSSFRQNMSRARLAPHRFTFLP